MESFVASSAAEPRPRKRTKPPVISGRPGAGAEGLGARRQVLEDALLRPADDVESQLVLYQRHCAGPPGAFLIHAPVAFSAMKKISPRRFCLGARGA